MINFLLIILGFFLLVKGADFLVDGASSIAKRFHIPEIVIGLTVVAIGTSMPELVVSVKAALEGHSDIAIGNVVGSNISNIFLILGICSIIRPLEFKRETRIIESPVTVLLTVLLFIFCNNGSGKNFYLITRIEGIILISLCIVFIIYNIIMAKNGNKFDQNEEKNQEEIKEKNMLKAFFYVIIGILGLKYGGDFVVNSCVNIAQFLGISEEIISLTIVAISTSLPELITGIEATRKNETDLAIGNILGSQTFNILLIIGTSAILSPINYLPDFNKYMLVLIMGSLMLFLFPFVGTKNKMTRNNGILFICIYILYIISLIIFNK